MGVDFSAGGNHLFVSEWVENDEGGTARSVFFVAPMDLELIRVHHAINGAITSDTLVIQNNGNFVAGATVTESADTSFVVEWEGNSTVSGDDIRFRTGDVFEYVVGASAVDFHLVFEFRRAA